MQPGNLYGPVPVGVGAIPLPGIFQFSAVNFTPAVDSVVTGLEAPVAVAAGPPEIDVFLLADAGDLPGSVIETYHVTDAPPAAGPIARLPIASVLNPVLYSGTQYWVAVTGGTSSTFALWALTVFTGDPIPGGATRVIDQGVDFGWVRNFGTRNPALVVYGMAIPEPGSRLLLVSGAALLWYARRRAAR
jgi:hypothetical protein